MPPLLSSPAPGAPVPCPAGYAASGRHRSQRDLRHEYDRLQRFQRVVRDVAKKAEEVEKKA